MAAAGVRTKLTRILQGLERGELSEEDAEVLGSATLDAGWQTFVSPSNVDRARHADNLSS